MIEKPKLITYLQQVLSLILIICSLVLTFSDAATAATPTDKNYLTLEILQEKLNNPIQQDGRDVIELNNYIIDLTQQDSEFEEQFYREIYRKISRSNNHISLDLSNSIIQGDFDFSRLGIATPLVEGALSSLLSPAEREQIKSYLLPLERPREQNPKIKVFRGNLKLDRAVFTAKANFSDLVFLQELAAVETNFQQEVNFTSSIFGRAVNFSNVTFDSDLQFDSTHFFARANFKSIKFQGMTNFSGSYFEREVNFSNAAFWK